MAGKVLDPRSTQCPNIVVDVAVLVEQPVKINTNISIKYLIQKCVFKILSILE